MLKLALHMSSMSGTNDRIFASAKLWRIELNINVLAKVSDVLSSPGMKSD